MAITKSDEGAANTRHHLRAYDAGATRCAKSVRCLPYRARIRAAQKWMKIPNGWVAPRRRRVLYVLTGVITLIHQSSTTRRNARGDSALLRAGRMGP